MEQKQDVVINKSNQEEIEEKLKKNINNLPKYAQQALNALDEKDKIDKELNERIEFLNEIRTPNEKREFIIETINNAKSDEKIKEALDILDEKDKIDKDINEIKKRQEQEKEELKKEFENKDKLNDKEVKKDNQEEKKEINKDEYYERALKEIEERHAKELEILKEKQERNIDNFNQAIHNLANSTSIAKLIESLKELDKSLALIISDTKELKSLTDEQRLEKLDLALKENNAKEAVAELVKDLHKNIKTAQKGLDELELEKQNYVKLDKLNQKANKDPKEAENLEKFIEKIDKETPNFKEHYPKTYEKSQIIIDKFKNNEISKEKEQSQGKSI
ncbi:hypothetical protein [Campylobacter lanienae]|uniref:hypothetical protein n=1 Tax=Campylobacter lanienae TaxID=75658 RepID=UPI000BB408E2|nr:hypothetical protein [Campylobacter lanienae]